MFKMLNKALQHALAGLTGVGPRRGNEKEKGGERGGKEGKGGERRGKEASHPSFANWSPPLNSLVNFSAFLYQFIVDRTAGEVMEASATRYFENRRCDMMAPAF